MHGRTVATDLDSTPWMTLLATWILAAAFIGAAAAADRVDY